MLLTGRKPIALKLSANHFGDSFISTPFTTTALYLLQRLVSMFISMFWEVSSTLKSSTLGIFKVFYSFN